jgi:hypothetical protein
MAFNHPPQISFQFPSTKLCKHSQGNTQNTTLVINKQLGHSLLKGNTTLVIENH